MAPTPATPGADYARPPFSRFMHAAMVRKYGENYKNSQLVDDSRGALRAQNVSRWLNDQAVPTAPMLRIMVPILGVNMAEAFAHAGLAPDADGAEAAVSPAALHWAQWLRTAPNDVTGHQLAERVGVPLVEVDDWFAGRRVPSTSDLVIKVAHVVAPDHTADALDAAGFPGTAAELRRRWGPDEADPTLSRIRNAAGLRQTERDRLEADYRAQLAQSRHYFELLLAEATRVAPADESATAETRERLYHQAQ